MSKKWDLPGDKKQEPSCLPRVKQQTCVPSGGMNIALTETPLLIFLFGKPSLGVKVLSCVPGSAAMEPAELQLGQEPDAADTRLGLLCRKTTYRKQFIGYYPAHSTLWCPESLYFPAPIAHTIFFAPELSFPEPAAVETEGQNEARLNAVCLAALAGLQPIQRSLVKAFENGGKIGPAFYQAAMEASMCSHQDMHILKAWQEEGSKLHN